MGLNISELKIKYAEKYAKIRGNTMNEQFNLSHLIGSSTKKETVEPAVRNCGNGIFEWMKLASTPQKYVGWI